MLERMDRDARSVREETFHSRQKTGGVLRFIDSRGRARSHHVLPGVASDERLGATSVQGGDAPEMRGSRVTVDLGLGCKRIMVRSDNTRDQARSLFSKGLGVWCSVPCCGRHWQDIVPPRSGCTMDKKVE